MPTNKHTTRTTLAPGRITLRSHRRISLRRKPRTMTKNKRQRNIYVIAIPGSCQGVKANWWPLHDNNERDLRRRARRTFLLTCHRRSRYSCGCATGGSMAEGKSEILQGTLDLMVLNTLAAMGPLHGYGIARRIEQLSEEALQINQGTIYASLVRLLQRGSDFRRLGSVGKQSQGEILFDHAGGPETSGVRGGELGTDQRGDGTRIAHCGAWVRTCWAGRKCWVQEFGRGPRGGAWSKNSHESLKSTWSC